MKDNCIFKPNNNSKLVCEHAYLLKYPMYSLFYFNVLWKVIYTNNKFATGIMSYHSYILYIMYSYYNIKYKYMTKDT